MKIHKRKPGAVWFSPYTYCGMMAVGSFGIVKPKDVTCKNCIKSMNKK